MNWLEESVKKSRKLKDHYMLKGIDIYIKDRLPEEVDIDFVIKYVAKRLPDHVLGIIDLIYIGQFQDLIDRDVNALWQNYLYQKITYNVLWQLIPGIFPSPYAVTSLREYFAKGFEEFYMGKRQDLKDISPVLFSKLMQLHDLED